MSLFRNANVVFAESALRCVRVTGRTVAGTGYGRSQPDGGGDFAMFTDELSALSQAILRGSRRHAAARVFAQPLRKRSGCWRINRGVGAKVIVE